MEILYIALAVVGWYIFAAIIWRYTDIGSVPVSETFWDERQNGKPIDSSSKYDMENVVSAAIFFIFSPITYLAMFTLFGLMITTEKIGTILCSVYIKPKKKLDQIQSSTEIKL